MSHTNVTIPDRFSTQDTLVEKIHLLEFQLKRKTDQLDYLEKEFANIPEAIEKYGYVDLSNSNGRFVMRIIKDKTKESEK